VFRESYEQNGLQIDNPFDGLIPSIIEQEENSREYRKNWARLIQKKMYELESLTCLKCQGTMSIISFIENEEVIEKILKHLIL